MKLVKLIRCAAFGLTLPVFLAGCGHKAVQQTVDGTPASLTVRIAYHKSGIFNILRTYGTLDKALAAKGVAVKWEEFAAGPQVLEAIGDHNADLGATGDTPPIFAQAAGVSLVYVANIPPGDPTSQEIIVPKNSPIRTVADLKGKKVAFQKGSGAHYMLVQALTRAGLKYSDIQPVYLSPPDAGAAFASGQLDAWVIWDPLLTISLTRNGGRVIADETGLPQRGGYYLADRSFAVAHPDILKIVLGEAKKAGDWTTTHPEQAAVILSPKEGLPPSTLSIIFKHGGLADYVPLSPAVIASQQKEADTFYALGLIPKPISIEDDLLPPQTLEALK